MSVECRRGLVSQRDSRARRLLRKSWRAFGKTLARCSARGVASSLTPGRCKRILWTCVGRWSNIMRRIDVTRRKTSAKQAQRGRADETVVALLFFAVGLTLLLTGFNDRASGESAVRVRHKPDRVRQRGSRPQANSSKRRTSACWGGHDVVTGAGVLYFSYRSPLGREPSPDDDMRHDAWQSTVLAGRRRLTMDRQHRLARRSRMTIATERPPMNRRKGTRVALFYGAK